MEASSELGLIAHEMLHKAERRIATTKTVREIEAETIPFMVSTTIGLDAGHASAESQLCNTIRQVLYGVTIQRPAACLLGVYFCRQ
jgi:hypothetical protein